MKILHISDTHIENDKTDVFDQVISALKDEQIDICLFTGDLVNKKKHSLEKAYNHLKDNLINRLGIKHFFITCGNHDIDSNKVSVIITSHIPSLKSMDDVNSFVLEDRAGDYTKNLSHLEEYNNLIKSTYPDCERTPLYSIHKFSLENKDIAVVSINTAWCLCEDRSMTSVIFPSNIIKEAANKIKKVDIKMLITHFDPYQLKPICRRHIMNAITENFDCIFCGHIHEQSQECSLTSDSGIFSNTAGPTIRQAKENSSGFVLLDFDFSDYEVGVINYIYKQFKYQPLEKLPYDIPTSKTKREYIKIRQAVENLIERYDKLALDLNVASARDKQHKFIDFYVGQTFKPYSKDEGIRVRGGKEVDKTKRLTIKSLDISKNYLITGRDKSGKTTMLYRLMLLYLQEFVCQKTIPIYYDIQADIHKQHCSLDIEELLKSTYNFSKKQIDTQIRDKYKVLILIDNITLSASDYVNELMGIIKSYPKATFISTSSDVLILQSKPYPLEFDKLELCDMSRKELRELTDKWPLSNSIDKEELINKLTTLFSHMKIHFNYWTVSMFLYIYENTSDTNINNNSELYEQFIEAVIDKRGLSLNKDKDFSYKDFRSFYSRLAHHLCTEKEEKQYCVSFSELVAFFEEDTKVNLRIVASPRSVIEQSLEKGILTQVSNDCFTFRLNGVFEYFLAFYMKNNEDFRKEVYTNDMKILQFSNELELYSGFNRNDIYLLKELYSNVSTKGEFMKEQLDKITHYEIVAETKNHIAKQLSYVANEIFDELQPIATNLIDELQDNIHPLNHVCTPVKVKEPIDITKIDANLYAKYLSVLGSVFRNSDQIVDNDKVIEIFRFIIDQSCLLICLIINDLIEFIKNKTESDELPEITETFNSLSPLLAHSFIYEFLNHPTLSKVIKHEIDILKLSPRDHQYKLFVLYFLLIENNIDKNIDYMDEVIETLTNNNIKQSIFIKLILVICFKCHNKPTTVDRVKEYISKVHYDLYPDRDRHTRHPKSNKDLINKMVKSLNTEMLE